MSVSPREVNQAFVDELSHILWEMKVGERRILDKVAMPPTLHRSNLVRMLAYRGWVEGNNCSVRKLSLHPETGEVSKRGGRWPILVMKHARARKYTKHKCNDVVKSLEIRA